MSSLSCVELSLPDAPRATYFGRETVAHYWYVGERDESPDPPTFGDCLFQVEQFVLDVTEQTRALGRPPLLVGVGQGAVLALAAAKVIPDSLSGVAAIGGYLPDIPGAPLPVDVLAGLPILMIDDRDEPDRRHQHTAASAAQLTREGADVQVEEVDRARALGDNVLDILSHWITSATASEP
jgi:predicted esterase